MLKGKTVILGVTGSIAAYKAASLASMLMKQHAEVHVLMTENAVNFINPITFETLTGHKCLVDTFDRNFEFSVEHVSLAKKADLVLIAPATANIIGKLAGGIADDMLTTTVMACSCEILVSPAMNTKMYENPVLQDNLIRLRHYGYKIVEPCSGYLACGDVGAGKLPEPEVLLEHVMYSIARKKDMADKRIMVTAGPTQEPIDPVRYLTNHSTGKMGYAIARMAALRGAEVTLISGPVHLRQPIGVALIPVVTADDMYRAVTENFLNQDIIVKAAAVADYQPVVYTDEKIKKSNDQMSLELTGTRDILKYLGEHKRPGQFLCGFSMETEKMVEHSAAKLRKKNLDMIVANNLKVRGAGFGTDTNVVTLISDEGMTEFPCMSKDDVADKILDAILQKQQTVN
ncbi:bifunctional phosphopantothenoylcysteine decarboxylase/phosphopantothenate--cysteine ligase CoaBC [Novisyntrophococcus fermenticellae]|uniref:bifunctional phosphopantothenoylcysteine decarboxylase/phosphopantothenate--cysteine ligase CoaBC n=1 Tax=Novisyntrophococcus fermenticellae TaxID=2068655 RepID=UPI001E45FD74|nr:bifunctional phosphopantothenoylcysteine decarboxylase/phosphopantothenate--cysteine ligase CoaBC [Novisyntrophococcus fermenticellae]